MTDTTQGFFCDMSAFTPEERTAHIALIHEIFGSVQEVRELPDGYAFRLGSGTGFLRKAVDFVAGEQLCCPFFGFGLDVAHGELWLRLNGPEGVKPFIVAEIGDALDGQIATLGTTRGVRRNEAGRTPNDVAKMPGPGKESRPTQEVPMKKSETKKKLTLSRETLQSLATVELERAAAGSGIIFSDHTNCTPTQICRTNFTC